MRINNKYIQLMIVCLVYSISKKKCATTPILFCSVVRRLFYCRSKILGFCNCSSFSLNILIRVRVCLFCSIYFWILLTEWVAELFFKRWNLIVGEKKYCFYRMFSRIFEKQHKLLSWGSTPTDSAWGCFSSRGTEK